MSLLESPWVLLFLASVIGLSLWRGPLWNNRKIYLFRALFPSWRFFDETGEMPVLYIRTLSKISSDTWSEWEAILPHQPRSIFTVVFNPDGNLTLALQNLLQQLNSDLDDWKTDIPFENSVSYRLVENWARFYLEKIQKPPTPYQYQFKINTLHSSHPDQGQEILVSGIYEGKT